MNQSTLNIKIWSQPNFRGVNKFYRSQKHKGSASGGEQVFVIYQNDNIIAAVRLVPFEGFYWLRSLYVKSELRGQSLGKKLLEHIHKHITLPIYCFPYSHLLSFYQDSGYTLLEPDQLPSNLQQLFNRYQGKGQGLICMAISPTTHNVVFGHSHQ